MALTVARHNRVLMYVENMFIKPLTRGIKVRLFNYQSPSPTEPALADVLSCESLKLLKGFSAAANKIALRPPDIQRWRGFVARAKLDDVVVDSGLLSEWLKNEGWPESRRSVVIDESNVGRSLLTVHDEERAPR